MSNEEKVLGVLKDAGDWLMLNQVANRAGISRVTASKFLYVLVERGVVETKKFASAQLFRAKEAKA
jgi:DNA-binding IclR family transcriptional regulator